MPITFHKMQMRVIKSGKWKVEILPLTREQLKEKSKDNPNNKTALSSYIELRTTQSRAKTE